MCVFFGLCHKATIMRYFCTPPHLHARVASTADGTAERIPGLVVEPFEELAQAIVGKVLGSTVVEPRVKL